MTSNTRRIRFDPNKNEQTNQHFANCGSFRFAILCFKKPCLPKTIKQVQAQYMGMIKVDTSFLISLLTDYTEVATTNKVRNMYMTDLVQQVVDTNHVHVSLVSGSWIEIDTIDDYKLYADKTAYDFGL